MQTVVINRTLGQPLQKEKDNRVPLMNRNGHLQQRVARASVIPVALLPDEEVLALSYSYMHSNQQEELSDLLADQREGVIDSVGRKRLSELMQIYRRGLVRKAEALKVAVERGLRPPLG